MTDQLPDPCLEVRGLRKSFGGLIANDDLSLQVRRGEIHAVIGPNGAGKTTLINLISGLLRPDSGRILFEGRDVTRLSMPARARSGLVRSFQITSIFPGFTVLENVMLPVLATQGHGFRFWHPVARDARLLEPALDIVAQVGLTARIDARAGTLAHGEQRQLEIAISLAAGPSFLLLDEPMAGMGTEESQNMVTFLGRLGKDYTILLIEHDMEAVFALADRITVLVYGRAIVTGSPDEIRNNPQVRQAYLGEEAA